MYIRQLSPQIGTAPASGELQAFDGGNLLGAPAQEKKFSSVLQAASQRVDARKDARSRTSQVERANRPSSQTQSAHCGLSSKTDGIQETKPRATQAERENRSSRMTPSVHRSLLHKAARGMDSTETQVTQDTQDSESHLPHAETDDQLPTATSDVAMPLQHETSSSTDTESHASQLETGNDSSTTASGSDPLLTSFVGATMVTPTSMVDSTQVVAGSDPSTSDIDLPLVSSESPMSQSATQPTLSGARPVSSEHRLGDRVDEHPASARGDAVAIAIVPPPISEAKPAPEETDTHVQAVEPSDKSLPLTAPQSQKAENSVLDQGVPIREHQEKVITEAPVPSGKVPVQGHEIAEQAATATTQPTFEHHSEVAAELDQAPVQQLLGKGEPSLHQKHIQAASSEPQAAAALSGRMQDEGQGFTSGSDGQRKDDGLKWLAHADFQSAEMPSRAPEPSTAESADGGHQFSSYQQGQGGAPLNLRPVSSPSVPAPAQTNQLSPDPEPTPVPRTHAVQFDLSPVDFGQLRVRVVLSDHTIHTHMSTDRAELGQMLTGQQEQLNTQLTAAGLDMGRFQVQVDQDRTNQSGQDWQSQPHQGTSQQQRGPRQQGQPDDAPVLPQKRTGMLSFFA